MQVGGRKQRMAGREEVSTEDEAGRNQQRSSQWVTSAQPLEEELQLPKETASLFPASASMTGTVWVQTQLQQRDC